MRRSHWSFYCGLFFIPNPREQVIWNRLHEHLCCFNFFKRHTIQLSPFRHKDAWTESAQELVELGCLSFGSLRVFSNLIKSISVLSGLAYTICRLPTSAKDSSVPFVVKLALHSYFWYRYSDESAGVSAVHVWSADL